MSLFQMSENQTPVGRVDPSLTVIWVQYHMKPERGDFLVEIAQEEASLKRNWQIQPLLPIEIVRLYDIQEVHDNREAGGRLEFFRMLCEEASFGDMS